MSERPDVWQPAVLDADPCGTRTVLNAHWVADADGLSDVAYGHHTGTADLVHFRFRALDLTLRRRPRQNPDLPLFLVKPHNLDFRMKRNARPAAAPTASDSVEFHIIPIIGPAGLRWGGRRREG